MTASEGQNGACTQSVGEQKDRVREKSGMACSETWVPFDSVCLSFDSVDFSSDSDDPCETRCFVCYYLGLLHKHRDGQ